METPDLKPLTEEEILSLNILLNVCPHCGAKPYLKLSVPKNALYFIMCPEESICRGTGLINSIDAKRVMEGIQAWNQRA